MPIALQENNKTAVVYLVWIPYGLGLFKNFIRSYQQFIPGAIHQLVLLFNGVNQEEDTIPYITYARESNLKFETLSLDNGQDIEAYFFAAGKLSVEFILFLNSYAEILSSDWLKKYAQAFEKQPGTGIVGSSGSMQSYYSSVFQKNTRYWEKTKGFYYNFRKYKLFIKAFVIWRFLFKPFPNPSIRTNAFMVRRTDFLKIYPGRVNSKFRAYRFESGKKSMTNYFIRNGMRPLIIDKKGKTYEIEDWVKSSTFWIDNQENLLVSDNQTEIYRKSGKEERKLMTKLAWGI